MSLNLLFYLSAGVSKVPGRGQGVGARGDWPRSRDAMATHTYVSERWWEHSGTVLGYGISVVVFSGVLGLSFVCQERANVCPTAYT